MVVSCRVETLDEPAAAAAIAAAADNHSSYIRSPRLEAWGRKPAAIVSPLRTPALSKAVQTQSLPNIDSDEVQFLSRALFDSVR